MEQRAEKGESLNPTVLWATPDERARKFQSSLSDATRQLPAELVTYSGGTSGMVPDQPGRARRGSQEPRPLDHPTNTWAQLEATVRNSAGPLQQLRQLLRNLPSSMAGDIVHRLETDDLPSITGARVSAQTLHDVVICELHCGNREGALENLQALISLVHLYADEPALVNYMIRVTILGLSIDACWDALQAPGWDDTQLAQLQQAVDSLRLLRQLPRVIQAERAARLATWESFRSHSYNTWLVRREEQFNGFGMKSPEWHTAPIVLQWRHCGFHPVWQFAWADQEELHYLKHSQNEFAAVREAVKLGSWRFLEERLNAIERDYRPPAANWRFHGRLPSLDDVFMLGGSSKPQEPAYPYPNYRRSWRATFEYLTLHQLVVTAIGLKRGVRFIQLYHRDWDHHGEIKAHLQLKAPEVDRATMALITDLKKRGLFDDTLIVWGGDFGRTPMAQEDGRDHHIKGFSIMLAGGGIKGGVTYGATDELGYAAVEDRVSVHDLHAKMLHLLDIEHTRLTVTYQGLDARLTGIAGDVVKRILA